jgi:hypothetical protein
MQLAIEPYRGAGAIGSPHRQVRLCLQALERLCIQAHLLCNNIQCEDFDVESLACLKINIETSWLILDALADNRAGFRQFTI